MGAGQTRAPGAHPRDRPSRRLRDHEDAVRARAGPSDPSGLQAAVARLGPPRADAELVARAPHGLRPHRHLRHALADRERHRLVRPREGRGAPCRGRARRAGRETRPRRESLDPRRRAAQRRARGAPTRVGRAPAASAMSATPAAMGEPLRIERAQFLAGAPRRSPERPWLRRRKDRQHGARRPAVPARARAVPGSPADPRLRAHARQSRACATAASSLRTTSSSRASAGTMRRR